MEKKLHCGISEKSRSTDIEQKCKWPSAMLDRIFDSHCLIYGELSVLQRPKTKSVEQKARELLLQRVAKNEPKLGFQKAKEIYKH